MGRESILIDRKNVLKIARSILGLTRPNDPKRWELRIVAWFELDVAHGPCAEPYRSPSDARTRCSYRLEVEGKPARGIFLDAVTGEPLFDRSLVIQLASVTASSP